MNSDPNNLTVEDDTVPIENLIAATEEQPVIPTVEELTSHAVPKNGIDGDAPYGRNKDGTPAKKRGRKAGTTADLFDRLDSVTPSTPSHKGSPPIGQGVPIAWDYRPIANFATGLWFGIPTMIFGDDWKPEPADEPIISKAFYDYFKAKGIAEVSPELGLGLALLSYTVVRVNKPTVHTRLQSIFAWIKTKARFKRG